MFLLPYIFQSIKEKGLATSTSLLICIVMFPKEMQIYIIFCIVASNDLFSECYWLQNHAKILILMYLKTGTIFIKFDLTTFIS